MTAAHAGILLLYAVFLFALVKGHHRMRQWDAALHAVTEALAGHSSLLVLTAAGDPAEYRAPLDPQLRAQWDAMCAMRPMFGGREVRA